MRLFSKSRIFSLLAVLVIAQGCRTSPNSGIGSPTAMPRLSATPAAFQDGKVVLAGLTDSDAVIRGQNYGTRQLPSMNTQRSSNFYAQYGQPQNTTIRPAVAPTNPGTPLGLPSTTVQPNTVAQPNAVAQPNPAFQPNANVAVQPGDGARPCCSRCHRR